jgi:DNA-directed RNA polymerase omega subunit
MYRLPEDLDSKYRFVTLASKRAEQLQMGALPRVEADRKSTVLAQQEVADGLIETWNPEEEELVLEDVIEEEEE